MQTYLKNLKKNWKSGVFPPFIVFLFVPLIASLWPQFEASAELFTTILDSPAFTALVGYLGLNDFSTWQGVYFMYIFVWLEYILLFVVIFFPSRMITHEIDKKTLDMTLSFPIRRWQYLLEKFMVFLTYNLLYIVLTMLVSYSCTEILQLYGYDVTLNYLALFYSLIGVWMWFFVLGAISLLCGALFLHSRKALSASAVIVLGMFILVRIGGMVESLNWLKYLSVFYYMSSGRIQQLDPFVFPVGEFFILFGVGLAALAAALIVFQKRELTY